MLIINSCKVQPITTNTQNALEEYFKVIKFVSFTTPNNGYLPSTIFRYSNGGEMAVAFPNDCDSTMKFDTSILKKIDRLTPIISETDSNSTAISLVLDPELVKNLDLKSAFKSNRLKTIKMELIEPFSYAISESKALNLLFGGTNFCKKKSKGKGNIIIAEVLGSKGVKFSFLDSSNQLIKLDVGLSKIVSTVDSIQKSIQGSGVVISNKEMFYAYRAFDKTISHGAIEDKVILYQLEPSEIERMKKESKNK